MSSRPMHATEGPRSTSAIRTLAERLARGRVLRRRLPSHVGGAFILVSPDSQLKYLKPGVQGFDSGLLRVAAEHVKPASTVWDIGANVGVFALAAAGIARAGSVLAVEADAWLAQLLRRSSQLPANRSLRLEVIAAAASDQNGVARLMIAQRGRASNYLEMAGGWCEAGGVRDRLYVPTLTLDTLLDTFPPPHLVKIDVEGAEEMVLKGASRLLAKVRPKIYIETQERRRDALSEALAAHGYVFYDGARSVASQAPSRCTTWENTLAVPG